MKEMMKENVIDFVPLNLRLMKSNRNNKFYLLVEVTNNTSFSIRISKDSFLNYKSLIKVYKEQNLVR